MDPWKGFGCGLAMRLMEPVPDFESEIGLEDLRALELSYQNDLNSTKPEKERQGSAFEYGCGLIKSNYKYDCAKGMDILKSVWEQGFEKKNDCLYYLALGAYRQRDLLMARKYIEAVSDMDSNTRALVLKREIEKKLTQDGLIGIAIVGGLLAVVGGLFYMFRKK